MGSCCTRSVFWVNWMILTAIYRLWNWRNRSAFTCDKPQEVLHFSIENLWRFGWQYIAQVSFARWRSSDKQLGPRTVNFVLIAARRCYTRIPVHATTLNWFLWILLQVQPGEINESHFVFQTQKGIYIHTNGKGTVSWDCKDTRFIYAWAVFK